MGRVQHWQKTTKVDPAKSWSLLPRYKNSQESWPPGRLLFARPPAQSLEPLPPSAETVGAASPYFAAPALWLSQHASCPREPNNCLTARSLFPFLSSAESCFSSRGRFGKRLPPLTRSPPQLYRTRFEEAPVDGSSANRLLLPPPRSFHWTAPKRRIAFSPDIYVRATITYILSPGWENPS